MEREVVQRAVRGRLALAAASPNPARCNISIRHGSFVSGERNKEKMMEVLPQKKIDRQRRF
jgi:hypothetical protein